MITCLIIDDERLARQELRKIVETHKNIEILDECATPEEAISKIEELKPDLIFLDIQMPGKTGFQVLEESMYIWLSANARLAMKIDIVKSINLACYY